VRDPNDRRAHFLVEGRSEALRFTSPSQIVPRQAVPNRNRAQHFASLSADIGEVAARAALVREAQLAAEVEIGNGIIVEFESFPDTPLAFESLGRERQGIELLNVRINGEKTFASVFVPDGRLVHFENVIRAYLEERVSPTNRRRDFADLVNGISAIRVATLRALWTDDPELFPVDEGAHVDWEVWLPTRRDRAQVVGEFARFAEAQGMRVLEGQLDFPERSVLRVRGTPAQMRGSAMLLNCVAELRLAKETAGFFDELAPEEQPEWAQELLGRTTFASAEANAPFVCVLDTGVTRAHPLVEPALDATDMHTIDPAWGTNDDEGHGTGMAGLALFGNLTAALEAGGPLQVRHRLESVKLLPHDGENEGDSKLHGYLTLQAVTRPEIGNPARPRVFAMAISSKDGRDRGNPSAWSSMIDGLASDAANQGENRRLFVVSAGNIRDTNAWMLYPTSNSTDGIHDPGQAWNALTVGAFTELCNITEDDAGHYAPIAEAGGLSPFSTTSSTWKRPSALKPDVVLEGGNAGKDALGAATIPSLSLLSCHSRPVDRHFTTFNATSAATALAGRMAAEVMAEYPNLWPETVRALIVHSAEWTPRMRAMYLPPHPTKLDFENLVRHCGHGAPELSRALWSASDSLTLISQDSLSPFERGPNAARTRDMHLHRLPWPLAELAALGEQVVKLRVTLSYFVEPNPSSRGARSRYRYESFGLRFDVKRPLEDEVAFVARVNAAARAEDEGVAGGGADAGWLLGKQRRHLGSVHSDVWQGTAVELASRGSIAVYPTMGWWRTRAQLNRVDGIARYALVVSIDAPESETDLYNAVENQLAIPIAVEA
jgi:hypothetical protein